MPTPRTDLPLAWPRLLTVRRSSFSPLRPRGPWHLFALVFVPTLEAQDVGDDIQHVVFLDDDVGHGRLFIRYLMKTRNVRVSLLLLSAPDKVAIRAEPRGQFLSIHRIRRVGRRSAG